jgi:hypothetical protein
VDTILHPFILYALIALGGVGVCIALPRRGLNPQIVGGLLAGLAGGALVLFLSLKAGPDALPNVYFYVFAAIALGAKIIEKHFYLNEKIKGPDFLVSLSPEQLNELCIGRDRLIKAMGSEKKVNDREKIIRSWAYRSLVTNRDLSSGDILTMENITSKRPGNGIPSWEYMNLIGKRINKDCPKNTILSFGDIQ